MSDRFSTAAIQQDAYEKRSEICNRWLVVCAFVYAPVVILAIYRSIQTGQTAAIAPQILLSGLFWSTAIFRHRIPLAIRIGVFGFCVTASFVLGLLLYGLLSTYAAAMVFLPFLVSVSMGNRLGLITWCGLSLVLVAVAVPVITGTYVLPADVAAYAASPLAWVFGFLLSSSSSLLVLVSTSMLNKHYNAALSDWGEKGRQLATTEKETRQILDQLIDTFFRVDQDGRLVHLSKSAVKLFGVRRKSLLGTHLDLAFQERSELRGLFTRIKANPDSPEILELALRPRAGHTIWVEIHAQAWMSDTGRILGVEGILADRTEAKIARQAMLMTSKLQSTGLMAAGISHDFNNNLGVVLGCLEALEADCADDPKIASLTGLALRGTNKAITLSRRLHALTVVDDSQLEPIDLSARIAQMEGLLDRIAGEAVDMRFRLSQELAPVRLDANAFEDALLNLVVNARDAMEGSGQIIVQTQPMYLGNHDKEWPQTKEGLYALVSVTDTGPGIPRNILPTIFDPFFSTKQNDGGTGLGLSMVQGFVTSAGGNIRALSPGHTGARFEILLPAVLG